MTANSNIYQFYYILSQTTETEDLNVRDNKKEKSEGEGYGENDTKP